MGPRIGDMVDYTPTTQSNTANTQPFAAVITHVHTSDKVSLHVFNSPVSQVAPSEVDCTAARGTGPGTWRPRG